MRWSPRYALLPMAALVLLVLTWPGFPVTNAAPLLRLVIALPLLVLAHGVLNGRRIATGLTGFLAMAFLAHGITEAIANPSLRIAAVLESLFAVALLAAVSITMRLGRSSLKPSAPGE